MKRRNLISMMIAMVLCLSFMTTTGFAETLINKLVIKTDIDEVLKAGEDVKPLNITVTAPEYPDLKIDASFEGWNIFDESTFPSEPVEFKGPKFIDGATYAFDMKISVDDPNYKFASSLSLEEYSNRGIRNIDEGEENGFDLISLPYKATETGPELNLPDDPGVPGPGPGGKTFTVNIDFNNGYGDNATESLPEGLSITVNDLRYTDTRAPEGKVVYAWEVNGERKSLGTEIIISENLNIKILWKDEGAPDPGEPGEPGGEDPETPEEPGGPVGPSETVKVIVDINNDKGQKMTINFYKGEEFALPNDLPYGGHAPNGKKLVAWEVNGKRKEIGEKITIADGMTLKALWENKDASDPEEPGGPGSPDLVKITFIYGEGSEDRFDDTAPKNEEIELPKQNELGIDVTKIEGKELYAWLVNGKRKEIGEKVKATEDLIIKALWKDEGAPDPETPETPDTPETPETPDPYYPGYYDDWYDWYEPSEPNQTKLDQAKKDEKPEEKKEEKAETKTETIERKVILTLGSKTLDNQVNGVDSLTQMDVAAYAKDGRTMLPIRFVAEALGMGVTWDAKTRTVIIEDLLFKVEIPIDTNKIIVNGETYTSDVKPEIVDGRTMMPIANIARALGLKDGQDIFWDKVNKQVTIIRTISR